MNLLFQPFAARLPGSGNTSPKSYPFAVALAKMLEADHEVIQVGSAQDMAVCEHVERGKSFKELGEMIQESDSWISVDTYLVHAAHYFKKRGVAIYSLSDPLIFGYPENCNLLKSRDYVRPRQYEMWTMVETNPEAFVKPEVVMKAVQEVASTLKIG